MSDTICFVLHAILYVKYNLIYILCYITCKYHLCYIAGKIPNMLYYMLYCIYHLDAEPK